ncbi:MAG: iron complex outermembrane receptor protein [Woeseiaceae bacterium]|jgi:iron complex outermembrane receptor protein
MNFNIRRFLAKSLCILVGFSVTSVNALEIEEIIVTAQKRAQNSQDVPVALDAFTGDMLQRSSIKTMRDLAGMTPSLASFQSQSAGFSSWGIRGLNTSSQNFGLESAVGSYVDNVYRARQSSIGNQLVDIEAVEILRGPQGTLFGKNTSAGAINIRTVAPSHDRNGFFEIVGGDLSLVNVNAGANMSLIEDVLAVRGTVFVSERDGFATNLTNKNGPKMNDRDRKGGRFQVLYTPSENTSMRLIADYAELDEVCCTALTKMNNFKSAAGAPGTDALIMGVLKQPLTLAANFNKQEQYLTYAPSSTAKDKGISLEINRDYENFTLTSVSAIRNFDTNDFIDADFGAAYLLTDRNILEQSSFSQELRFSGDFAGANGRDGHYQFGAYYYSQDMDNNSKLTSGIHTTTFLNADPRLTAAVNALAGLHTATGAKIAAGAKAANPALTDAQAAGYALSVNPFPVGAASSFPDGAYARDVMKQKHKSYAFFGQVDIPVQDNWTLTAGMRYTNEDKTMNGTFTNSTLGGVPDIVSTTPGSILWTLGALAKGASIPIPNILAALKPLYAPGWGFYTQPSLAPHAAENAKLEDHRVTGNVKIAYQPNDDMLFYGSYSTGYKAGGTNTDRLAAGLAYVFLPETNEVLEAGAKMDLGDTLRLNMAAWKMNVDNLQVSTFAGNAFNLTNAGRTEAAGGEIDLTWAPTEYFSLDVAYSQVVATAKDFQGASCWIASPFHTGKIDPGAGTAAGNADATSCDHSGLSKAEPENRLFVGVTQGFKLGDTAGYLRLEHQSVSESDTLGSGDPLHFRPAFTFANARLGFIFEELNSELAIWVRNATDERFYESVFNNPVQDGSLRAYTTEPRTWGVNFRINFD